MGTEVLPQFVLLISIVIGVIELALLLLIGLWYVRYRSASGSGLVAEEALRLRDEAKTNMRTGWMLFWIVAAVFIAIKLIGPIYRLLFVG